MFKFGKMRQVTVVYTTFKVQIIIRNIQLYLKTRVSITLNGLVVIFWDYISNIGYLNGTRAAYCITIYRKVFKLCWLQEIFCFLIIIRNYFAFENLLLSDKHGVFSQGWATWNAQIVIRNSFGKKLG